MFWLQSRTGSYILVFNNIYALKIWTYALAYLAYTCRRACSSENYINNYCLTLHKWRPSWILPRMQCPKILFDHTTIMSGIHENPLVDTQIMNHYILLKLYQFIVWPYTNDGHFISAYLQVSVSILTFFLIPGDWRPFGKMQIMLRQVCKTIPFVWNLKSAYYHLQLSLFVGFCLAFDFFTVFTLRLAATLEICKLG